MNRREFGKTCAIAAVAPLSGIELAASAANYSSKYIPIAGGSGLWVQPHLIFHPAFQRYGCTCDECLENPSTVRARFMVYNEEGKRTDALAPPLSRYIYSLHSELPGHVFSLETLKDQWGMDVLESWASLPISIARYFVDFETGRHTWPTHPTQL